MATKAKINKTAQQINTILTKADNIVTDGNGEKYLGDDGNYHNTPRDGVDGQNGTNGVDGSDGVGISNISTNQSGENVTLTISLTDGTTKQVSFVLPQSDGTAGTGLTQEQLQKLSMLLTSGDGSKYLGDDGTYHNIPAGNAGTSIDDTTSSNASTWSSSKIHQEIENKTVSQSQINSAVNSYLTENPPSGVTNALSEMNIAVFGDSLSDANVNGKWMATFQRLTNPKSFKCYGRGFCTYTFSSDSAYNISDTSNSQVGNNVIWNQLNRLKADIENNVATKPDLIICMAGSNDAIQSKTKGTALTTYSSTLTGDEQITSLTNLCDSFRYTMEQIQESFPNATIIILTPPQCGATLGYFNSISAVRDTIIECCKYHGLQVVDMFKSGIVYYKEKKTKKYTISDGLHLTDLGGEVVGKYIFDEVSNNPIIMSKTLYGVNPIVVEGDYYSITKNTTNSTVSGASRIEENASYTATVSANTGYTLNTVTVTMGGIDITSTAYSNGTISIASVTGNVVITVTTTANTYTVTKNAINCTITGNNAATHGSSYTATIEAYSGYTLQTPTITMGGNTLSGVYSNGTVTISNVTGNIVITANAIEASQEVHATAISLSPSAVSFSTAGDTSTITSTLTPSNTTDTVTSWVSSDTNVATVANGVITSVADGSATITATTSNGLTATVSVTVSIASQPTGSTKFYASSVSPVTFAQLSNRQVYYDGVPTSQYEYMAICANYFAIQGYTGGKLMICFSDKPLRIGSETTPFFDDVSTTNYELYTAPLTANTAETPSTFSLDATAKEKNALFSRMQYGFKFANYTLYRDNTESTVAFAKNYEQTDYE